MDSDARKPKAGTQTADRPKDAMDVGERQRIEAAVKSDYQAMRVAQAMQVVAPSLGAKIDALAQENARLALQHAEMAQQNDALARQGAVIERQNDALKTVLDQVLHAVVDSETTAKKAAGGGKPAAFGGNDQRIGDRRGGGSGG